MERRIKYAVREGRQDDTDHRVVVIDRITEDAASSGRIEVERLIVLSAHPAVTVNDEITLPPSSVVIEHLSDATLWSDGRTDYESFDVAYIAARMILDLPVCWTGPDDSRIGRALIREVPAR